MREAIGIFGGIAGAIVIALVGRYGFVTSDTPIDGAIVAFMFSTIAVGGIAGPAVAVHLFRSTTGWAKAWGLIAGVIAAVSLLANLTNSLGAIAGRADKTEAQRTAAVDTVKDAKAELARIDRELAALPPYAVTDDAAVRAAQRAADAATKAKDAECGNGNPKQRGLNCRGYEATERQALAALTAATANRALTDRAAKLEAAAAAVRAQRGTVQLIKSANPLADALGRIFRLEPEVAATGQQVATVVVVELLIAFALIAFELLRAPLTPPAGALSLFPAAELIEPPAPAQHAARGLLALVGAPAGEVMLKPADGASVARFMLACMPRAPGEQVSWGSAYARYQRWCSEGTPPSAPLSLARFGEQFRDYCERARIQTLQDGARLYCLDVKLAS